MRRIFLTAGALAFALSSLAFAQDDAAKMTKEEKTMQLKSASCDPSCGFSVRSHDEKEIVGIIQTHAKAHHAMDVTEADVKKLMKDEMMVGEEIKKVETKEMKQESGDDD